MRKALSTFLGILILLFVFASQGLTQRHHLTYTAAHFHGGTNVEDYYCGGNYIYKPTEGGYLFAPVTFPDSANGMQVTRLSCSLLDNSTSGRIRIQLVKVDRWTGYGTLVGDLSSSIPGAENNLQYLNIPKSQMAARGIDNNRWAWYLSAYFSEGNTNLFHYHVTIRYE